MFKLGCLVITSLALIMHSLMAFGQTKNTNIILPEDSMHIEANINTDIDSSNNDGSTQYLNVDPIELLNVSDIARGGEIDGVSIKSTVSNYVEGEIGTSYTMLIESVRNNSLVTFLEPARSKGILMLMKERNMWFISPDVSKPVPISPRQRLLGGADNGDIATANYNRDYNAQIVRKEKVEGKLCYVLNLTAKNKMVTYDRIEYYIDEESLLGLKAKYFTVSGKHLKTAYFEYDNSVEYQGENLKFVSKMTIFDELNDREKTILTYQSVRVKEIPRNRFNMNLLSRR